MPRGLPLVLDAAGHGVQAAHQRDMPDLIHPKDYFHRRGHEAVVEDVTEVRAAAGPADLRARHPMRSVVEQFDSLRRDGVRHEVPTYARSLL